MSCRKTEQLEACFTDAAGVPATITMNTVFNDNGSQHAVYYTDAAGEVVDTSVGTVMVGACPVAQPDVEWEQLCDVDADGVATPFLRRSVTRFDAAGAVIEPVEVASLL